MFRGNSKTIAFALILILCLSLFPGCSKEKNEPAQDPPAQTGTETNTPSGSPGSDPQPKTDSGHYQGQIDSNSIEIKIGGVPDNMAYRAFQLSEPLKENFESYGFKANEEVLFKYTENEGERPVIIEISRIK